MTSTTPTSALYHYTCNHRLNGVIADRALMPNPHPWIGIPLVWLTDLDVPDRAALGLTAEHLRACDRTENRVAVSPIATMRPWIDWARDHGVTSLVRDMIEGGGARPRHWWVSPVAVEALTFERSRPHIGKACA